MGYLEQFARNRRRKEKSEVLTARLPHSLYSDFKAYCDELGLSISEAVCLLVEREMTGNDSTHKSINNELATTLESNTNTHASESVVKTNTSIINKNTEQFTTKRFNTIQWQVNGRLPCPICNKWASANNFSTRHSKKHGLTSEELFTSDEYREKINAMIAEEKSKVL